MIATIEEISLNALPALQTFFYGGWIVRMGKGYSRRANSVQTFGLAQTFGLSLTYHAPHGELDARIAFCETLYHQNNLPVIFKMTPASQPSDLDNILQARGYHIEGNTLVQTCDLSTFTAAPAPNVRITETWQDEWYDEFCRMNKPNPAQRDTLKKMLQLILMRTAFASLSAEHGMRACGLGVLQETYLGLFDIVVDETSRRKGYGKQLVSHLLAWGKTNGAQTAYLQVVANNLPALNLYAGLGFVNQYPYWYRVRA